MQLVRRWLSVLLIAVLAGAPVASFAAKARHGTLLQEVCSPSGAKLLIALDLGGPQGNPSASHDQHDCCGGCGPFALALPALATSLPAHAHSVAQQGLSHVFVPGAAALWNPAAPRGPPCAA
jgi:Protein of unknown function (DUF2946)